MVKGDSLLLLDDANSYWWLIRVLKTEDVGYIPAENIETPYERLARLNKHRNVDIAAATVQEKGQEKPEPTSTDKANGWRKEKSGNDDQSGGRRVIFAPPTYVEHPGVTWSSDEEEEQDSGEEDEEDDETHQVEKGELQHELEQTSARDKHEKDVGAVDESLDAAGAGGRRVVSMEPDDGIEWADSVGLEAQERTQQQRDPTITAAKSKNPFGTQHTDTKRPVETIASGAVTASDSTSSLNATSGGSVLDPAQASNDIRRITVTPAVAQGNREPLLPSTIGQTINRKVSEQSVSSVTSVISTGSSVRSITPTSPPQDEGGKKMKKSRKGSKEDIDGAEKKKRGVLGGLFSRNKKDKKGNANGDPRTSEDSTMSAAVDSSPASQGRYSEDSPGRRPPTPGDARSPGTTISPPQPIVSSHGLRVAQRDQALQQAYTSKYLSRSGSTDSYAPNNTDPAAVVAYSAAAMRLSASMNGAPARPSSIILSPNPVGPPLLNVIRIFAGEHIRSDASFKTALINETTSSTDLIRQAMQRFHLHHASTSGADAGYYLTVKGVNGEETELASTEKPLAAFQEAVRRWSEDDDDKRLDNIAPTVKRSSVSSISSVISLSSHPAIAKLGMNDFSDDSVVKIYLHRQRPGSAQIANSMPEFASEFSSYSTQLSTVQESSPETKNSEWTSSTGTPPRRSVGSDAAATPLTPQQRFNPSLTVITNGQASPERFSSPSSRFTIQLIIMSSDLPDGSFFDPTSDSIIPRALLKDRQPTQTSAEDARKRLLVLPRNATVVEAIEQGLDRFGIQEGVVDGGDDIEDRGGNRRVLAKVRYSLAVAIGGEGASLRLSDNSPLTFASERTLSPSSKILEAYPKAPSFRPMERITPEQRRRSRDAGQNTGSPADILPTDPVFVLRRVGQRSAIERHALNDTPRQLVGQIQRPQIQAPISSTTVSEAGTYGALSPQEIIAAQREASRANQKALISAQSNAAQGVDVVLPDRGTLRSSRLLRANVEVVRYSYIDGDGETYDISELLEEEWGKDGSKASPDVPQAPALLRQATDQSAYVTAPSTPEPIPERSSPPFGFLPPSASQDILRGVVQRAAGQPDRLEEKLQRMISKVKSGSAKAADEVASGPLPPSQSGRNTPQPSSNRVVPPPHEDRIADTTPRASDSRSTSRQANQVTASDVNRIISRHRQQPSIASILSDLSVPNGHDDDAGSSTPLTTTSSSHPTPPFSGAVYTRSVSSASPTLRAPVVYKDDFGIKAMMAVIEARAREYYKPPPAKIECDEVERMFYGERVDMEAIHPDIRACFAPLQARLDAMDREIDELLGSVIAAR